MSVSKRTTQIQFRLSISLDHALQKEAERRGLSLNETAKKMVIAALTDTGASTFKGDTHLRHSAMANFTLIYLSVFLIMSQNPTLTEEQATEIANKFIFSKAGQRVQSLLQQLGIGE
ncbi:hypothetical protein [Escherichia coli]|uniref:hypothetical protein n=1 Tax=Escherichia coli TaxID=562 RepID=UPI0018EE5343|nr:hypothetical protein [Escherichia coli]EGD9622960.1 hypothetical protein [Shigella flexneri]MBJ6678481.1 hypothetical protein [Escherichia coli]HCS6774501.1 hypothetical protein [Escherichia coli]HDI9832343.1 hypothetical protein [Escherichia coli]